MFGNFIMDTNNSIGKCYDTKVHRGSQVAKDVPRELEKLITDSILTY